MTGKQKRHLRTIAHTLKASGKLWVSMDCLLKQKKKLILNYLNMS